MNGHLEHAIAIAAKAHAGQTDKAGAPYILHPLRVMLAMKTDHERIVAVLHDVVEDSDWTLESLRQEGFDVPIIEAVDAVTRRDGEDYKTFIKRVALNPIGQRVKFADLMDNCDMSRIAHPTEKDLLRLKRYQWAIDWLEII